METVSFLSDDFTSFLHLSKKKGASGSRDGWYPGLITTNASLQNKFEEEGATGSYSPELRCHAEQVIKIYRLWLTRLREVAVDRT